MLLFSLFKTIVNLRLTFSLTVIAGGGYVGGYGGGYGSGGYGSGG